MRTIRYMVHLQIFHHLSFTFCLILPVYMVRFILNWVEIIKTFSEYVIGTFCYLGKLPTKYLVITFFMTEILKWMKDKGVYRECESELNSSVSILYIQIFSVRGIYLLSIRVSRFMWCMQSELFDFDTDTQFPCRFMHLSISLCLIASRFKSLFRTFL